MVIDIVVDRQARVSKWRTTYDALASENKETRPPRRATRFITRSTGGWHDSDRLHGLEQARRGRRSESGAREDQAPAARPARRVVAGPCRHRAHERPRGDDDDEQRRPDGLRKKT